MKQLLSAVLAAVVLAFSTGASAAHPDLIVGVTGTELRGLDEALLVRHAADGSQRAELRFPGGTSVSYVVDDANWTKYTKIRNQLVAKGAMQVGASDTFIVVTKAIAVDCYQNASRVWFANTNNPESIGDSCAFRNAVAANAN